MTPYPNIKKRDFPPEPNPLPIRKVEPKLPYYELAKGVQKDPTKLEEVLKKIWHDGYNTGLKHMDKMHGQL